MCTTIKHMYFWKQPMRLHWGHFIRCSIPMEKTITFNFKYRFFQFLLLRHLSALIYTAQKLKFFIIDFFSKCDETHRKLGIRSNLSWNYSSMHLLKNFFKGNFIFCPVSYGMILYRLLTRIVTRNQGHIQHPHCVKSVSIWSFSGPYFPAFELNTEKYYVSLRIQSKCGKMWTRKTSQAVPVKHFRWSFLQK